MIRIYLLLIIGFFCLKISYSQYFIWNAGTDNFFDNREYFNKYVEPQSMLGTQIFASAGFLVDENNSFYGGFNFLHEYGSKPAYANIKPTMYFRHASRNAKVYMGSFSRRNLITHPNVLLTDTFKYYRPNVEGIYLEFSKPWGSQTAWLDWTSRQTETDRETFLIGGTGTLMPAKWFLQYNFLMYHYAGTAIPDSTDHIRDNGGLTFHGGINLSENTFLDSLCFKTGLTFSYDRLRHVYDTDLRLGSLTELYASYNFFGLRTTNYFGEGQIQMVGDGLYSAKFYNRTDLIIYFFKKNRVKSFVEFSLHFLPEVVDVSQKFSIYIDISGKKEISAIN
ncbi:MAG: hypothetical protein JXA77_17070 [Bacteroidales bacterium]|nr:hypothetical protein [Bacteroidales bacterium]MBN2819414.1 hypothetical protein [Bacteroidales bacterium]